MIIEFSVQNYKSIRDKQSLSLVHDKTIKDDENNVIFSGIENGYELLKSIGLYGRNNVGKTNIFSAFQTMVNMIIYSEKNYNYGDKIENIQPFILDKDSCNKPCDFDITFIVNQIKYRYMVSLNEERIYKEVLEAYPNNNKQVWFERTYSNNEYHWNFSVYFKLSKGLNENTLDNVLFLSKLAKDNNNQIKPIYSYFNNLVYDNDKNYEYIKRYTDKITSILNELGLKYSHCHICHKDKKFIIPSMMDSSGVSTLLKHIGLIANSIENGTPIFIDNFGENLDHIVVNKIIKLFHNNKNNAQLIFATSNPITLCGDLLRRDQVYIINKENDATKIIPLKRAKKDNQIVRKGENLMDNYILGNYNNL